MAEQTSEHTKQPTPIASHADPQPFAYEGHRTSAGHAPGETTPAIPDIISTQPEPPVDEAPTTSTENEAKETTQPASAAEAMELTPQETQSTAAAQPQARPLHPATAPSFHGLKLTAQDFHPTTAGQHLGRPTQLATAPSFHGLELTTEQSHSTTTAQIEEESTQTGTDNFMPMDLTSETTQPRENEQGLEQASELATVQTTHSTSHVVPKEPSEELQSTTADRVSQPSTTANHTAPELSAEEDQQTSDEQAPEQWTSNIIPELTADEIVGASLRIDSAEHSETDLSDRDSAFGDDGLSTSASSLNSDVTDFRTFGNRRYHAFKENQYWLPNDDEEISRLELQHLVWRLCLNGRLHIAPIPNDVHRVLDLGTGTGKWAIEFADHHPSAEVIGTDLSPIQPVSVPSNCSFIVENVEDEWVYPEPFDYIHSRMIVLGIHDWKRYFQQCYDNLKPGGWCEVQETKFPIHSADPNEKPENSPLIMWSEYIAQAAANDGILPDPSPLFRDLMEEVGFTDIREQPLQWPIGPWPKGEREKLIGKIMIDNVAQFYRPSAMALYTKRLGWSVEQVDEFMVEVGKDLADRSRHYFVQM